MYNLCRWLWRIWGICFCNSFKRKRRKFTEFMWFIHLYSLLLSGVMKPCSDVHYTHTQLTDNNTLQPEIVQFQQAPVRVLQPCPVWEIPIQVPSPESAYVCRVPCTEYQLSFINFYPEYYESPFLSYAK